MLKISIVDSPTQRRLILEGMLVAPWITELKTAWRAANRELEGRELVIDMADVFVISQEAENVLVELIGEGVRFHCNGVFTRHLLRQLARKSKKESACG